MWILVLSLAFFCFSVVPIAALASQQLPFMAGETWWCSQGWYGSYSHPKERALDFNLGYSDSDRYRPILAPLSGLVIFAGDTGGPYGKVVLIQHSNGNSVSYERLAHLHSIFVVPYERVTHGQVVGLCGDSGTSAVHLHINSQSSSNASARGEYSLPSSFYYITKGIVKSDVPSCCECGSGDVPDFQSTSVNSRILDLAYHTFGAAKIGLPEYDMWDINKARSLNPHHPWYSAWNPSDLYRSGGIPRNCYIQHLDGGTFWDSAIVYDALGGARQAYVLHSGFWVTWTNRGGPLSSLGMPITNEYTQGPPDARQDFLTKTQHRRCDGCGQKTY